MSDTRRRSASAARGAGGAMKIVGRVSTAALAATLAGCSDTPADPSPVELRLAADRDSVALRPGEMATLVAVVTSASGDTLRDHVVTWSGSDTTIARVSPSGVVTAVSAGRVEAVAAADDLRDTVHVEVGVRFVAVSAGFRSVCAHHRRRGILLG